MQAGSLDPSNPIYPSNRSAALYELGDYLGCMNAILHSWSLHPEPALALKLSTRLPKAISQGIQAGTIRISSLEDNASVIRELEGVSSTGDPENAQAWMLLKHVRSKLETSSREARIRFSRMPIYKGIP
jgi:hypothetical protein